MNKKISGDALAFWNRISIAAFAFYLGSAAMASSEPIPVKERITLQSTQPIVLSIQSTVDLDSPLDFIALRDAVALNSSESNLTELLTDGVHPPEPAEPPQPKGKIKIRPQFKPRTVPAIPTAPAAAKTVAPKVVTPTPTWSAIGPTPIPNGQTAPAASNGISLTQAPVSGRTTAIAIDPADPNIAYVGTAQGGLYRTLDGGSTWTQLFDNALSLAIGVLQLDPSDSTTLLIGSGESNFSGDSFAGVGVYKITDAKGVSPMLSGPYNQDDATGSDISAHRSIPGLAIDPNNHDVVYIGTSTGQQGIGPQPPTPGTAPNRGLYRSTNFFSGAATFTKIPVIGGSFAGATEPSPPDYRVTSIAYEPGSSDRMFVGIADNNTATTSPPYFGGLYYTSNATAANPTFTRLIAAQAGTFSPFKIAIRKIGTTVTVAAVSGEPKTSATVTGTLYTASYSSSAPPAAPVFTEKTAARGFAGGQGSYNIAVDIDPVNANNIYITGTLASTTDASGTFKFTRNGGTSFSSSTSTLHVDSHMVGVAPSNPDVIYTGNDGGVWKTSNGTSSITWTDANTPTFSATQFQSIAVHPIDRNFSIGGTQDNGTEFFHSAGFWTRADYGDGGYALIDQTATSVENTVMYHTYYNVTQTLVGFSRVLKASCAREGQWALRGGAVAALLPDFITPIPVVQAPVCDGSVNQALNGLDVADNMNFYAPMTLGPPVVGSMGQTIYFGTDKLYRSIDQGDHMTVVSQILRPPTPPATTNIPISSIAISPQNDNVRVVGTNDGKIFATTVGAPVLVDVTDANMPAGKYVGRIVIDPNDQNIVYVGFNGNAIQGKHVWKGNLAGFPLVTWTALDGATFPDISVNALAVDPLHSNHLYAGTDRGVYFYDAGAASPTWSLYGTGLPNVQVFDLAIQSPFRILRAATHGRGFYEVPTAFRVDAIGAVSRKVHGATPHDILLPVSGTTAVTTGIECRSGGAGGNHQLVLSFGVPVTFTSAAVTSGTGMVGSTSGSGTSEVIINLSGVANAQTIVVTLNNVFDGTTTTNVAVQMALLAGDSNADRFVDSADISQTKAQSGKPVTDTNFREDFNVDGFLDSGDISFVKSKSGTALP